VQSVFPLVVKPREAAQMLRCSRKRVYQLLADKELDSFKDGRSRKITVVSIENYISRGMNASCGKKLRRPT
jgi:excisionase family DNA binding protein